MKITKLVFLTMAILAIGITSCSKDEDDSDVRDQAIGTYNYKMQLWYNFGSNLQYLPDGDDTGTLIVKKSESNDKTIEFWEAGELSFTGNKIEESSDGFTFDIASQTIVDPDTTYTITGYEFWDLGGTKYHGAYTNSTQKIEVAFQANLYGDDYVMIFTGTKD